MQQRRGTAQQWTDENPTLAEGEVGFETDTYQFKIGNGVNAWASLDYFSAGVDLSAYATETYVDTAVSDLVDSAPGVLDTLNELAAAINDDENFFTSITTAYQQYADQAETDAKNYADSQDQALSSTLTQAFENYTDGATTDMATTTYVDTQDGITLTAANQYTDTEVALKKTEISQAVSSNITAQAGYRYLVNTSSARTITLPSSPSLGDEVQILDATENAGTNVITVNNNGEKINGIMDTGLLDVNGVAAVFIYTGSTYGWRMG